MAKQATSRVSTVKQPNGQQTETGKETLKKKMFRIYFPYSKFADDSYDNGQGQQNNGICKRITNRGDWNLARRVINQSKIRWALRTLKPFESAGRDGIILILLQQGAEHVVPHLCRIFRACMAYGLSLLPGGKLK
jgi:hypothetical protein